MQNTDCNKETGQGGPGAGPQAAQSFTKGILNTIREPLLVLDGAFCIEFVNDAFRRMFLIENHDVIGMSLFSICGGKWDVPDLRRLLGRVLPNGTPVRDYAFSIDTGASGRCAFALDAHRMGGAAHGADRILLALHEITGQDLARNDLTNCELQLNAIVRAVPEAVITFDARGTIIAFNPAAEKTFGFSASEIIGESVRKLMPLPMSKLSDDQIADYIQHMLLEDIGTGLDGEARRKDDALVPVHLQVSCVTIDDRQEYTCILHDLTEERTSRVLLEQAQKMEAVGQLTGGIAHDFNNLLTVVIGNLELLEMRRGGDPDGLLSEALEAANLGAALTAQLLGFSKRQPLAPKILALPELIEGLHPLMRRTLGEPIAIKTSLRDDLDPILAEPGQIECAVLNMAINARDAMPGGGTLTIEARNRTIRRGVRNKKLDLSPGRYVELSVIDTGAGMAPAICDRAFDPFFSTKDSGARTGLGLSMVYGFAKQSGGTAALNSKVGQGTRISLYLPSASDGEPAPAGEGRGLVIRHAGETVLLVEDDPRVRHLTRGRLEFLGYKVVEASDGPDGLRALQRTGPVDLVLSDVVMPGGMTGFDLAEKIAALYPEIRIVLSSGLARSADGKAKGPDGRTYTMLRKPYGLVQLSQTLSDLLE